MTTLIPNPAESQQRNGSVVPSRREHLLAEVEGAAQIIGTALPLTAFVGLNPLAGLEDMAWPAATALAARTLGIRTTTDEMVLRAAAASGRISRGDLDATIAARLPRAADELKIGDRVTTWGEVVIDDLLSGPLDPAPVRRRRTLAEATAPALAAQIDRRTARWCAAYTDEGQAAWTLPGRERGLYGAWLALGRHEPGIPKTLRAALRTAPADPVDAILGALDHLGVPDAEVGTYLQTHLCVQPGWASHLRWREQAGGSGVLDLLALRLVQEAALLPAGGWLPSLGLPLASDGSITARDRAAHLLTRWGIGTTRSAELEAVARALAAPEVRRDVLWQEAYERGYQRVLLAEIGDGGEVRGPSAPAAQVVCCIDTRSEGLRRNLEAIGDYETFGFAGFFGVAMAYQPAGAAEAFAQCPVPVPTAFTVTEEPRERAVGALQALVTRRRGLRAAAHAAHASGAGAFPLAEATGVVAAPVAAARTFAPGLVGALRRRRPAPPATQVSLEAVPLEQRIDVAEGILRGIGIVRDFAPLIVFCGHESHTTNNPYASALDCGACGGHGGAPNARAAAALINDPAVREGLASRGIHVPDGTRAIAAIHETTADHLHLLDVDTDADPAIASLAADLNRAGEALTRERSASLPGAGSRRGAAPEVRTDDWAQVFPEWGLAGNAALIVGPRARTYGVDLGRRTFLHSYDAALDPGGAVLEQILTAPLVVAHGLNSQYYASAVDPLRMGSGTKAVHNVVGGVGVTAAAGGDLLLGLPWQSIADGDRLVHEPMRLLVLVEAPRAEVDRILAAHDNVRALVDGEWLQLLVRETPEEPWQRSLRGDWLPVTHAA